MNRLSTLLTLAVCVSTPAAASQATDWTPLFNGKDLSGWEVYVTPPYVGKGNVDVSGEGLGLNPEGQTAVVVQADGTIKIDGRLWGGMNTVAEYGDYHFRCETRWGDAKFAPRDKKKRDSGIIFHAQKPQGGFWGVWMGGCEYQVQEGDFGDFHSLALPQVSTTLAEGNAKGAVYSPVGGAVDKHASRIQKSVLRENPHGEWNRCEIIARGDEVVHITNGLVNNRYSNVVNRKATEPVPMTRGHIQFQSEGAEVYYRAIDLRSLAVAALKADVAPFGVSAKSVSLVAKAEPTTVTFTNNGESPVDVVAFELFGTFAQGVLIELPELPVVVAPGGTIAAKVSTRADARPGATAQLRVETLGGPSAASVTLNYVPQ